jgi:hypothetical protein
MPESIPKFLHGQTLAPSAADGLSIKPVEPLTLAIPACLSATVPAHPFYPGLACQLTEGATVAAEVRWLGVRFPSALDSQVFASGKISAFRVFDVFWIGAPFLGKDVGGFSVFHFQDPEVGAQLPDFGTSAHRDIDAFGSMENASFV